MDKRYLIFISSTYEDLVEERKKVIQTVLEHDCFPASMEFFPAVGMRPEELIEKVMKECDYCILVIGDSYGTICKKGKSYTEIEYEIAIKEKIPVLAFLHKNTNSFVIDESKKLMRFRERVKKGAQITKDWSKSEDLPSLVSSSISKAIELQKRRGWVRGKLNGLIQNLEVKTQKESYVIKIDDIEFKMVHVEGGTFEMGATSEQFEYAEENEKPAITVTVDDFWIGEAQVTQALWEKIMGYNPSYFSQSNGYKEDLSLPVEQVTWNDCQKFIGKLNKALKNKLKDGMEFDFPTEEQWEFAARGGKNRKNSKFIYAGAGEGALDSVAKYDHNSEGKTWPVAESGLKPNELGLYDMSGNVWEWCKTILAEYNGERKKNSVGKFVCRGGCWHSESNCCRVSFRGYANMVHAGNGLGLRLVLNKIKE